MLPPHYYLIMVMAVLTLILLRGRRFFDEVLAVLHAERPDEWDAAGRPHGFFWQPEEGGAGFFAGTRARQALFKQYMREPPEWVQAREPLLLKLFWARVYILFSYLGLVAAGITIVVLQST